MEVCPIREAQTPKYPRMDEVDPEEIRAAIPRRWKRNRAAKAALALGVSSFTGYTSAENGGVFVLAADAGNIAVLVDGKELAAANLPAADNITCLITATRSWLCCPAQQSQLRLSGRTLSQRGMYLG